jgi:sugar-phosphatase
MVPPPFSRPRALFASPTPPKRPAMPDTPFPHRPFAAFLFDMDGTILSSIAAAERVWAVWASGHGLNVEEFLPTIHGVQAVQTIRNLALPGVDPEAEAAALTLAEMADMEGVGALPGAAAFLAALPADRWAIVTSAPRLLALRRIEASGLPMPRVLVAAEDVAHGKPAPDCFLLAAERLGLPIADCLVFEDAPAGIAAAEAAGASVVVVTATHHRPLDTPHPRIADYAALRPSPAESGTLLLALSG